MHHHSQNTHHRSQNMAAACNISSSRGAGCLLHVFAGCTVNGLEKTPSGSHLDLIWATHAHTHESETVQAAMSVFLGVGAHDEGQGGTHPNTRCMTAARMRSSVQLPLVAFNSSCRS